MSSEKDITTPKELTHDWELFPEKYLTDANGSFILKKNGTNLTITLNMIEMKHLPMLVWNNGEESILLRIV